MTLDLVHSKPSPDMEQRVLRIRNDALILKNEISRAQARSAFLILERARDDLSAVLERADWEQFLERKP